MVLDRHARNVHQQLSKINLFFGPSLYLLRRLLKDSDQKIDSVLLPTIFYVSKKGFDHIVSHIQSLQSND